MSKHTKGPWIITSRGIEDNNGYLLFERVARSVTTEDKANARLIAAAPELLEALSLLLETADDEPHLVRELAFKKAKEAIAKAEGSGK